VRRRPAAAARRAFFIGGGGVALLCFHENSCDTQLWALKQRTGWTGVFSGFTCVSHFTCDLRWAASVEKLTVNMHVVHNFTGDQSLQ